MTDTTMLATPKHCGRLDPHEPHRWTLKRRGWCPDQTYRCKGFVLIEGGAGCALCQRPVAACRCYEARMREWAT